MIEQIGEVIHEIENGWSIKRLLVVGDVMLDRYVWGDVGRISPEAPVPNIHAKHAKHYPGGARECRDEPCASRCPSRSDWLYGGDEDQKLLHEELRANGVPLHCVVSEGFPTITKLRILGGKQQMLRLDKERAGARPSANEQHVVETMLGRLRGVDAVMLSDYAKGVVTQ